jgi:hypothetical protein
MPNKLGAKFTCETCGSQFLITRPGDGSLTCEHDGESRNKLGKRLACPNCRTEALCSGPGEGVVHCCSVPMNEKAPKQLPSAD